MFTTSLKQFPKVIFVFLIFPLTVDCNINYSKLSSCLDLCVDGAYNFHYNESDYNNYDHSERNCALILECECNEANVVCPKWSFQPFSTKINQNPDKTRKIIIDSLHNAIPFRLIEWFLPKLMARVSKIAAIEILNFCNGTKYVGTNLNLTNAIPNSPSVKTLKLSNNCLQFPVFVLNQFLVQNLTEMNLSFNIFTQIPTTGNITWQQHLKKLQKLDLSNNYINYVSRDNFKPIKYLNELNLSMNSLKILPQNALFDLTDLHILDLSYNFISYIPEFLFLHNFHLQHLKLNNNYLTQIPKNIFQNSLNLFILDLSRNKLKTIATSINMLRYLKILHLDFNYIDTLQLNAFENCTSLIKVTLSHNLFTQLPSIILPNQIKYNFHSIEFDFSNNKIKTFQNFILSNKTNAIFIINIKLNLTANQISLLPNKNDSIWPIISSLDLSHNKVKSLSNLNISNKLNSLYLNNNSLTQFQNEIKKLSSSNVIVKLAGNPWNCSCEMSSILLNSNVFIDKLQMICIKEMKIYKFTNIVQFCPQYVTPKNLDQLWLLLPFLVLLVLTIIVCILVYHKTTSEILSFLFSKICVYLKCVSENDIDADKCYDAFVSYHSKDEEWVANVLVPGLETGTPPYKLCLHDRDWLGGELITDQIIRSVHNSKRTIIVLTENFLQSIWSRMEFDVACQQTLTDKVPRLIIVVPNEVPDLSIADDEFRTFITLTTYIQASKPHFWRLLKASMPVANASINETQESNF